MSQRRKRATNGCPLAVSLPCSEIAAETAKGHSAKSEKTAQSSRESATEAKNYANDANASERSAKDSEMEARRSEDDSTMRADEAFQATKPAKAAAEFVERSRDQIGAHHERASAVKSEVFDLVIACDFLSGAAESSANLTRFHVDTILSLRAAARKQRDDDE